MKKTALLWSALALPGVLCAENLIKNTTVDAKLEHEYRLEAAAGHMKMTHFTEDLTWNKCAKMEVLTLRESNGNKVVGGGVRIGGTEAKILGFPVKGDTVYKFSLELKGTAPRAFIGAIEWSGPNKYKDAKSIKTAIPPVKVQKDWIRYSGTFKTSANAKHAALNVSVWGDEKYKDQPYKVGDYLLIDNVSVEEAPKINLTAPKADAAKKKSARKVIGANASAGSFYKLAAGVPAAVQTTFTTRRTADALVVTVRAAEPEMTKLAATSREPGKIWNDDCIELFFAPQGIPGKPVQLVVSPSGNRYTGIDGKPALARNREWSAKIQRANDFWSAEITIPFAFLGKSALYDFFVGRLRKSSGELSSWTAVPKGFHDRENYGLLVMTSLDAMRSAEVKKLSDEVAMLPESAAKKAFAAKSAAVAKLPSAQLDAIYNQLNELKSELTFLKLGNRKFAVSQLGGNFVPVVPFLPDELAAVQDSFALKASVNERKGLTLALTNLGKRAEEYRVYLLRRMVNDDEQRGFAGPMDLGTERITAFRAVRVKDSENANNEQRLDALAPMDITSTVLVPPGESALLHFNIDCRDIKPGKYTSTLRVIPLGEPAKWELKGGWKLAGAVQDIPVTLEVLPIVLDKRAALPFSGFKTAMNEKFFKTMADYGMRNFMFSPWSFDFKFDDAGNVTSVDTENVAKFRKNLNNHLAWMKKYGIRDEGSFLLGFSTYRVFQKSLNNNRFKEGSPAWKNAWKNNVKAIAKLMRDAGIPDKDWEIEVWDEPHNTDNNLVLETCKLAKEADPAVRLSITLGASMQPITDLEKWLPYVDSFCFWGSYFNDPAYVAFAEKVRKAGKHYWFYYCNTSLRDDLYGYYRRHAWIGQANHVVGVALFTWLPGPGGFYARGSWKTVPEGAVSYRAFDENVSSIRLEYLRRGFEDLKYLAKLRTVADHAAAAKKVPELVKAARKLLQNGPERVANSHAHDKKMADQVVSEAIELILQIEAALK